MPHSSAFTPQITSLVCQRLQELARHEETVAADEAARTPYWAHRPASAIGHSQAARVLREEIDRLERALSGSVQQSAAGL